MRTMESDLQRAIDRSMSHNVCVSIEVTAADITDVVTSIICIPDDWDWDVDYASLSDGIWDVWGWHEDTPKDEHEWRLRVTLNPTE